MAETSSQQAYNYKITTIGSLILSIYFSFQFILDYSKLSSEISTTPFSNFFIFIFIYWIFYYLVQIVYIQTCLSDDVDSSGTSILSITNSVISFNLTNVVWVILFKNRWYLLSEILVIIQLFVILNNYLINKVYSFKPLKNYLIINLTVGSLPLSWIFMTLFWNGSLMIHSKGLAARILANCFIWDFLIIGWVFLFWFNDYTIGLSLSYLVLGLALNQLFTKLFALQWIFAFVISGILFASSIVTMTLKPELKESIVVEEEPLLAN
ncbi:hypothetical protein CLIB1444_05S06964 [[Candida] jaroonii]|uniref:Uncharacterized protein n=1 Tax=[Candida] jaroonii TaxID=467808 RepID=A0ACA9Y8B8_9ASCO|nr:hypothetical protein CLIB1444_05S06964 [[Candida] jaroonii]